MAEIAASKKQTVRIAKERVVSATKLGCITAPVHVTYSQIKVMHLVDACKYILQRIECYVGMGTYIIKETTSVRQWKILKLLVRPDAKKWQGAIFTCSTSTTFQKIQVIPFYVT